MRFLLAAADADNKAVELTNAVTENPSGLMDTVISKGVDIGVMILGAIIAWIVGGWIIRMIMKLFNKAMSAKGMDPTLTSYLETSLSVILKVLLVVVILGIFGIETTSFAAIFAAAGVAIGMAWSGLLANFAAGVFLIVLRPIKVGDFITAGGVTGTVREIGLFVTVIDQMDNVKAIVGNNKIFSDNIQNFSANPYRRVELKAQLNHGVDYKAAIAALKPKLAAIPNLVSDPEPFVDIVEFNLAGPVLAVRPFCHNDYYWDTYFATNRAIKDAFGEAGFPVPETHHNVSTKAA